ncbi:hypothetical protein VTL71DRAFT_10162 [Oculimacula yallundae]|uniref:Uncharacterized protein n=1 Tax=Oculimacula yallundae TaxID=86028 RepID=A0ABR4BPX1_9HELO
MSPQAKFRSLIVLGLFSQTLLATDGGHDTPSKLPLCPASCVQTITVTSTASCSDLSPNLQTSTASYIETRTNDGVYVNATTSSGVPYTTAVISSATIVESTGNHTFSPSVGSLETSLVSVSSSTINAMDTTSISSIISTTTTIKPSRCHHDNCLRHFIRHPEIKDFCATYTTALNTATSDLPDYVSQCRADPTRLSSACACIVTPIISINPSSAVIQTTKTAGGVFTSLPLDTASPTTARSCSVPSVIFETYTTTTTFSVTVSAAFNTSFSTGTTAIASSAPIMSFISVPYFNSTAELMTSLSTSTR